MNEMESKIGELDRLQRQIRRWRMGGVLAVLAVVVGCLLHVRSKAEALVQEGPTRDVFLREFKNGVTRDALPEAKTLAVKTMDKLGPALQHEVVKMEQRIPEFTRRAEAEVDLLRRNLPQRMEHALQPTIGRVLERRVADWQKQYPNLTAEQLAQASGRLANEANERMVNVAASVMVPFEGSWGLILEDLATIRKLEAGHEDVDSWDLALVSVGLLHNELVKLSPEARRLLINATPSTETK